MKQNFLLILSVTLLFMTGCKTSNSDPKTVLSHFFDALATKNIEEAKKYVTKDSESVLAMIQMGMKMAPDSMNKMYNKDNLTFGDPVIDGSSAKVNVKEKISGEETTFLLKKESGDWKVAFDKSTLMEMAQKEMKEKGIKNDALEGFDSTKLNLDSIENAFKNMSAEDVQKMKSALDSAGKLLEQMNKDGKMDHLMDSASKMLDQMKQNQ